MTYASVSHLHFPKGEQEEDMVERSLEHIEDQLLQLITSSANLAAEQRQMRETVAAALETVKSNSRRLDTLETKAGIVIVLSRIMLSACAVIGVLFGTRIGDWCMRVIGLKP